ncbi:MAG: FtsH protease activity modulator HflK [Alphaproteobacteria bacterium]|nr:FtsH protease activity modulator HflK [Alphaproteobacteria bacterium]
MAWDDQDDQDRKKGPWGSKNPEQGGNGKKPNNPWDHKQPPDEEIPDIDAMLRQAQDKLGNIFSPKSGGESKKGLGLVAILVMALWLGTGFYRVLPEESAVVLTFGKWTSTRGESGLGYHIPWPIQTVMKVNVAFDRRVEIGFRDQPPSRIAGDAATEKNNVATESQMLTGDENIVDIDFVVMWRIGDARNYLFQIRDPETTIKKVAESAMREIIARGKIQTALTEGRADIEARSKELMQKMLDDYQSGISINSVQLLRVDPPAPVVDAFDDVQRARSDRERTKNEAETYRNDIVPRARGDAQKLIQDAGAYKEAVISKAEGEAARFLSVYDAYAQSRDVTAKRIYIETMQQIMQNSKKVIVGDGKSSSVLPYLSLDQLQGKAKAAGQ